MLCVFTDKNFLPESVRNTTLYTFTFSDSPSGDTCHESLTIPNHSCEDGICKHILEVPSLPCHTSYDISLNVLATNVFGTGPLKSKNISGSKYNKIL